MKMDGYLYARRAVASACSGLKPVAATQMSASGTPKNLKSSAIKGAGGEPSLRVVPPVAITGSIAEAMTPRALDAATSLKDLSPLKSVGLHKLSGDRAGQWAMTVNGPWRICFRFKSGNAYDVEITDYHKG